MYHSLAYQNEYNMICVFILTFIFLGCNFLILKLNFTETHYRIDTFLIQIACKRVFFVYFEAKFSERVPLRN